MAGKSQAAGNLSRCVLANIAYTTHSRISLEKGSKAVVDDRGVIKLKLALAPIAVGQVTPERLCAG